MFEIDGKYANRKGNYKVLTMDEPTMSVRYEDGTTAELNVDIQFRIWENIVAEQEAIDKRAAKSAKKKTPTTVRHFIKVVNVAPGDELAFPGWEDRVVMVPADEELKQINNGDRLIYYSPEAHAFIAVVTITGDSFSANPKKYTFTVPETKVDFFQIDVDADAGSIAKSVALDSVELESCPDFANEQVTAEMFCPISEDDFELLAELLVEISEAEDEDDSDNVDEDEDFDEDEE